MRQRIKLAQAIAHEPELLILDEPLSGMDPIDAAPHGAADQGLGARGTSVLVSSHILHEIESMTSNIVLINNGRIVAEGDVHQIRDLIDEHPHTVSIRTSAAARASRASCWRDEGVVSVRFEPGRPGGRDGAARRVLRARDRPGGQRPAAARSTRSRRPTTTCRPCSATW